MDAEFDLDAAAWELAELADGTRHLGAWFSRRLERRTGMSAVQAATLRAIAGGAQRLVDVAEMTQQHTSGASRTVDSLVEAGWVRRGQDAADRRTLALELTAKGRRQLVAAHEAYASVFHDILKELPPDLAARWPALQRAFLEAAARVLDDGGDATTR